MRPPPLPQLAEPHEEGLQFQSVTVEIAEKTILWGVSGGALPGRFLAIMGPSGQLTRSACKLLGFIIILSQSRFRKDNSIECACRTHPHFWWSRDPQWTAAKPEEQAQNQLCVTSRHLLPKPHSQRNTAGGSPLARFVCVGKCECPCLLSHAQFAALLRLPSELSFREKLDKVLHKCFSYFFLCCDSTLSLRWKRSLLS